MIKIVRESISFENLKEELIDKILQTVYKKEGYNKETIDYLESLDISELDQMLSNYYMFDIQRETNDKKLKNSKNT